MRHIKKIIILSLLLSIHYTGISEQIIIENGQEIINEIEKLLRAQIIPDHFSKKSIKEKIIQAKAKKELEEYYNEFIKSLGLKYNMEDIKDECLIKNGNEFDINRMLPIFNKLTITSGFIIDYCYKYNPMGSFPYSYIRKKDYLSIPTYEVCERILFDQNNKYKDFYDHSFLKIKTDGSAEGFYQLALFCLLNNRFYRTAHASYYDYIVIAENDGLKIVMEDMSFCTSMKIGDSFYKDEYQQVLLEKASAINFQPQIEMSGNAVTVSVICFSKWSGFFYEIITFKRVYPHMIIDEKEISIIKCDCGIRY